MTNNKKRVLEVAQPQPQPAAQVVITAFNDRPPTINSSATMSDTLRLLALAITTLANAIDQEAMKKNQQADMTDKPREFLGPREE